MSTPQVEALLVVEQAMRRRALLLQSGRASTKDSCKNAPSPGFLFLATDGSSAGEFVFPKIVGACVSLVSVCCLRLRAKNSLRSDLVKRVRFVLSAYGKLLIFETPTSPLVRRHVNL